MSTVQRIKDRMEDLGITQAELSRRMVDAGLTHWHQTTVSRTLSGERALRLDEAVVMASQLHTTVGYLGCEDEQPTTSVAVGVTVNLLDHVVAELSAMKTRIKMEAN